MYINMVIYLRVYSDVLQLKARESLNWTTHSPPGGSSRHLGLVKRRR
jgi:hypothetical protein